MVGPTDIGVAQFDGGRTWGTEEGFDPEVKSLMKMKEVAKKELGR